MLKDFRLQILVIKHVLLQVWEQCVNALDKDDIVKFKDGKKLEINSHSKNLWVRFLTLGGKPDETTLQNEQ